MKKIILGFLILVFSLHAENIYATFNIEADKSANLAFYTGGLVESVFVDVSSVVKKGDKLVQLKNDDLKASLKMAKAELQNAEVTLKFAKKDYERQLLIKDLIDEAKFDKYELFYETAKVSVAKAKANVAYQQSLLERSFVLAPFDGVIYEKNIDVGDVVSGLQITTVLKIQSQKTRKLIFEFDQRYWKSVKVGDKVKYSVNGDTKTYKGKISKLYPHANSDNRKIKAELITKGFVVGLFGDGYIIMPDKK